MSEPAQTAQNSVVFVLKGYPRLSETFIAQEIHALEQRGLNIRIVSLRHPTDKRRHAVHGLIKAAVRYLPEYLYQEPLRVFKGWRFAARMPGYKEAKRVWLEDLKRDKSPNRIRRFGQACVLAHELEDDVVHLHAHFLHTPSSVARYTAMMMGLPWTASAHARDIWTSPDWELAEKLGDCRWLVTCTALNAEHLGNLSPRPDVVELMYHGLDLSRFDSSSLQWSDRDGSSSDDPVRILSVGRAVEKKGYDDLLDALARIEPSIHWRFTHIGGGALTDELKQRAERLGIAERIDWLGARNHDEVIEAYRTHDIFTLASRVAADGDRDGLPNVLVEAQSQGLASVATLTSAIPELVTDGKNGILVEARDVDGLARSLTRVIQDASLRQSLGKAGHDIVHTDFNMEGGITRLLDKFHNTGDAAKAIGLSNSAAPEADVNV